VTLVPDNHNQLTSDHGWETWKNLAFLKEVISRLQENGIRTSIFVDPDTEAIEGAAETGTNRIELYTEPYARLYPLGRDKAIEPFVKAAIFADKIGIEVNAGHDLSLENLNYFHKNISELKEVSIGHALIADALYFGLEASIQKYLDCLK
jgi:pyridoxine 5-phosphate synthase